VLSCCCCLLRHLRQLLRHACCQERRCLLLPSVLVLPWQLAAYSASVLAQPVQLQLPPLLQLLVATLLS
jgi:hypothetical protein